MGNKSTTVSGKKCEKWTDQKLHKPHNQTFLPEQFPNGDMDNSYCRNPNGNKGPWCYTDDPDVIWEYCFFLKGKKNIHHFV